MGANKFDATNGAFSGADMDGRWDTLEDQLERVRKAVLVPLARFVVVGCELTFWSEDAEFTVSASLNGQLVAYLRVLRKEGFLLAGDVAVKKDYRRRGIATAMYNFAESVMQARFVPCTPHSPHAEAFWSNRLSQAS